MYKVILFNHGQTAANGQVLLDTSSGENPGLTQAVVETKLNEAGSFTYSIVPTHPLYNMTSPLKVYVSVEEDGNEIFYGRILSVQTNPFTKIKSVTCEGALAFLLDCELEKDDDDWDTSAADYFRYCVNKYNEYIDYDPNRLLRIGTIDADEVQETHTYNNGSYTQVQSVMKSQLLNVHDGFFRVRRRNSTGDHYIDWLEQVGQTNPQQIAITQNVISQTNTESGEDIFSVMRPIGNDDLTLDDASGGLIPVSQTMLSTYGPIIRSVSFDADDAATLRGKALNYINKIRNRLSISGDISFVDFHFLDGSSTIVHVGDVFTHIEGYEGVRLTADSVSRNLLDAGKDKLTLKNDKELMNSASSSGANSSSSTGTSSSSSSSSNAAKSYKYYHETTNSARIQVSEAIGKVKINTDNLNTEWTLYKGSEIYVNQNHITSVCGSYTVTERVDPVTGETIRDLVIKDGTALYQSHDGGSFGLYDAFNLTGGIVIKKINGNQTETAIRGDKILIGPVTSDTVIGVTDGSVHLKRMTIFDGSDYTAVINNGKITAGNGIQIGTGKSLTFVGGESGPESQLPPISLSYTDIDTMIVDAQVDSATNTLKIWKRGDASDSPSVTFRKATTLSGTWGGSLSDDTSDHKGKYLTVNTDIPQGPTYLVKFEGTYAASQTNLEVHSAGSLAIETDAMGAKLVAIPVKVQRLTGAQSEPETVYETTINAAHIGIMTPLEATENKRYNLAEDPDHIGYSYVDVNVVPVLSGTWDGNTLSVTSNPRGNTYQVQVGGTPIYSASRTNLEVVSNGSTTVSKIGSTKYVDVPVKVQRLTGAQTAPVSVYETTLNPIYANLLTPLEVTTNGSYNLANDDNHIGFSYVNVNTPMYIVYDPAYDDGYGSEMKVVRTSTTGSGYMQFSLYNSGTPRSNEIYDGGERVTIPANTRVLRFKCGGNVVEELQLTDYRLGWNAAADAAVVPLTENLTSSLSITVPAKTLYVPTRSYPYDLSADYDHAYLKWGDVIVAQANVPNVTINKGTWSGGQISFTKSGGTASTKSVRLNAATPVWSGNIATVRIWDGQTTDPQQGGLDTGYTVTVNASGIVSDAVSAVTVTYDKGTMKDGEWLPDTWSSGNKMTVRLYKNGSQVNSFNVDASGLVSNAVSAVTVSADKGTMKDGEWEANTWSSGNKMTVRLFKNSTQVNSIEVDASSIYDKGYDAVSSPSVSWPDELELNEQATSISITCSTDRKKDGTARSASDTITTEQEECTVGSYTHYPCVNIKNSAGSIVGRQRCGTIYNNGAKATWLYKYENSNYTKVTKNATLEYGKTYRIRYTAANGDPALVADARFYAPEDRYSEGYQDAIDDMGGGDTYYDRGTFYCSINTQGTQVTLTRTYSAHSYPSVFSNGSYIRLYTAS